VPENYLGIFEQLLSHLDSNVNIKALILLKNLDQSVVKSSLGLYFLGAGQTANSLIKNIIQLRKDSRKELFASKNIPVLEFKSLNDDAAVTKVKELECDLVINLRTRCIYKKAILEAPKLGCINIHHGLLPKYRGTLCDLYALSENRKAGFTIHRMNKKIDAGKILEVVEVSTDGDKNYQEYLRKASLTEGRELAKLLNHWSKEKSPPHEKNNECDSPIFTKNPTRKQIKDFKKQGLIL
tara:strand:+ start:74144 stop:74860 length:717 start_codon:yes stop_codon:yes gene_type:complete